MGNQYSSASASASASTAAEAATIAARLRQDYIHTGAHKEKLWTSDWYGVDASVNQHAVKKELRQLLPDATAVYVTEIVVQEDEYSLPCRHIRAQIRCE